ncbi:MAG TPA: class I SAM-dependent methyltransferase [Candidatus Acidoferrales bacterium]
MNLRFPFDHPEITAVLTRLHEAAAADKWKIVPRLPRYFWAKSAGHLGNRSTQHRLFSDLYSAVTPERGAVLYLMARAIRARQVVEFGSSFGISTIYLATAVRDNFPAESAPAAQVTGSDMEESKVTAATKNIQAAGLANLARILPGDALQTLREVEGPIDMAFLDGPKDMYLSVLEMLEPKLRQGAVIISDNIDSFRKEVASFLEYVQTPKNGYASSTLGLSDGMEISVYQRG